MWPINGLIWICGQSGRPKKNSPDYPFRPDKPTATLDFSSKDIKRFYTLDNPKSVEIIMFQKKIKNERPH
jgi:hypothetical protein